MPACLLDSNVWLAAAFAEHPAHAVAREVLRRASAADRRCGAVPPSRVFCVWPPRR